MPQTCFDCGCDCSLIDISCIYKYTNIPPLAQVENNAPVLNAANERIRSLLGTECYNEFCAARTSFLIDNIPLPTKWQTLFDNIDFKMLAAKWIEYEFFYNSPLGRGYTITPHGFYKGEEQKITQSEISVLEQKHLKTIDIYEKRIQSIISAEPYDCQRCACGCGSAANTSTCGCKPCATPCGCNTTPCGCKSRKRKIIVL